MRTSRDTVALSYPLRLLDEIQADVLRLLDVSRQVINLVVTALFYVSKPSANPKD